MGTTAREAGLPEGALATTIGPLADAPAAAPLHPTDRALLARWRDERWTSLEQRAGSLAARDAAGWYDSLVFERWRNHNQIHELPSFTLGMFYSVKRFIPRSAQLAMRRRLIKRQGLPAFPEWPFEAAAAEAVKISVADALLERGATSLQFPWFWPNGAQAAVALTHDVESADGLARAPEIASWEERHGFRSSFNIVSDWYPIDMAQVNNLADRGHEIGSHAVHHDRSLFMSRASFERQLPLLREAAERFGAVGFRSPATHRVVEWLSELPFSYDCTMPHSDPYEPIPGGTTTVWPFFHGDVVELPYTAPQDHTLFNLLGHRDCSLWRAQLDRLVACNGLLQVITHPDREYLGRLTIACAYRELLEEVAKHDDIWIALPREVADWWRRRAAGLTPRTNGKATWTGSGIEFTAEMADQA